MDIDGLIRRALEGERLAIARLISVVEGGGPDLGRVMRELYSHTGSAYTIGITGAPGAGKSSLTERLVARARADGHKIGVLAIDPSSPFSGGALLGDRVRMQSHATDPDVFIRSMATRGHLGGISLATPEAVRVLDASGKDIVFIETVGVGQAEVEITDACDSTVVVVNPGWGDAVQAAKAGLMEIADIFVVNKADRPGAERVRNDIELVLGIRHGHGTDAPAHHGVDLKAISNPGKAAREAARRDDAPLWTPPVVLTVAHKGEGVGDLVSFLDRHHRYLEEGDGLRERRRRRLREQVMDVAEYRLRRRLWNDSEVLAFIDAVLPRIERGEVSPYGIADELLMKGAPAIARTSS